LEETRMMLEVYADFAENYMAMPVIKGEKTVGERFPGAEMTVSIEAMMQDRKALQAGTSHFLGQNFARAQEIKFQDDSGSESFAWTTSWGVSTRLIGALIMTHSDDDGLVLPPRLAPKQVVIIPVLEGDDTEQKVLDYCESLRKEVRGLSFAGRPIECWIDKRDVRGKKWDHVKKGVPIRLEVGPRDIESDSVFMARRDQPKANGIGRAEMLATLSDVLQQMQDGMFERALQMQKENTKEIDNFDDFKKFFKGDKPSGFALCHFVDEPEMEEMLKPLKVTPRCIPLTDNDTPGKCIFTGKDTNKRAYFAKAY